jgi:hypothetical protein
MNKLPPWLYLPANRALTRACLALRHHFIFLTICHDCSRSSSWNSHLGKTFDWRSGQKGLAYPLPDPLIEAVGHANLIFTPLFRIGLGADIGERLMDLSQRHWRPTAHTVTTHSETTQRLGSGWTIPLVNEKMLPPSMPATPTPRRWSCKAWAALETHWTPGPSLPRGVMSSERDEASLLKKTLHLPIP